MAECSVCRNFVPLPGPSNGFINGGYGHSLEESSNSCLVCSILWEGLCAFCQEDPGEVRWMAFKSEEDLPRLQYLLRNKIWIGLHFYTENNDSRMSETFNPWEDLPPDTGCASNLEQAKNWIRECNESHDRCKEDLLSGYLPTRVLDVSAEKDRVFVAEGDACRKVPYVALSHCWGDFMPIKTTASSLPVFQTEGICLESLPKTFRQAVFITRLLGCSYLWIDSFCIIQDNREDWAKEAPRMADVYRNSHLTLAAMSAANCTEGLFFRNDERQVKYVVERGLQDGSLSTVYVRPAIDHSPYEHGFLDPPNPLYPTPLIRRAWFFQEQIFSPRIIFFTNLEIIWQCHQRNNCICKVRNYRELAQNLILRNGVRRHVPNGSFVELKILWERIVESYSERELTYDSDKLAAIASIAGLMSGKALGRYVSGLWDVYLAEALTWTVNPHRGSGFVTKRSKDKSMPTWSWASVISPIHMVSKPPRNFEVIDILYEPHRSNSLVEANSKAIIIRGKVRECRVWRHNPTCESTSYAFQWRTMHVVGTEITCTFTVDVVSEVTCGPTEAMEAIVLSVHLGEGLVLCKVDDEEGTYRRIGDVGDEALRGLSYNPAVIKLV
ncbi:HET-domain-containing protein [Hypoxylon sp. FL0543]|nr:HET-domain-containing protein [Hypoxylon sp. FL0543]